MLDLRSATTRQALFFTPHKDCLTLVHRTHSRVVGGATVSKPAYRVLGLQPVHPTTHPL
jgi:hypothetical protein